MAYDVLIVDDEKDIRDLISGILSDEGYETRTSSTGVEALEQISARQPHIVILDVWLGNDHDGLRILEEIRRLHFDVPVIMISGHATIETAVTAIKNGAYDFIEKPFQVDKLLITMNRAMEASRLKRENAQLKVFADQNLNLLGQSAVSKRLKIEVERALSNNWRIFLSGPSGCGKSGIAKYIHEKSPNKDKPFITVNCAHIYPHNLEAELFGVEVIDDHNKLKIKSIGLVEKAHQGTLYFNDIDALPLPVQAKIAKLLTEEKFSRVGSKKEIHVHVRYMASSTEKMQDLIQNGDFMGDVFYRLNVLPIEFIPLRERIQDLSEMINALCEQFSKRHGVLRKNFDNEAIIFLKTYTWPHDLSELKSIVDWTLTSLQNKSNTIVEKNMLPMDLLQDRGEVYQQTLTSSDMIILPIKEAREAFEKTYLQKQINRFSGNISHTAKFVGMERSALHRKLKILGLTSES